MQYCEWHFTWNEIQEQRMCVSWTKNKECLVAGVWNEKTDKIKYSQDCCIPQGR